MKTPTIKCLSAIIRALKPAICDDYREDPEDLPSIQLTIGCGPDGWSWQSGYNSYSGGAYLHPHWGVGYVTRRCNSRALAREIINDALSQAY